MSANTQYRPGANMFTHLRYPPTAGAASPISGASPRLPVLTGSPRDATISTSPRNTHLVGGMGALLDPRMSEIRRMQMLNLTPRLGGGGRIGQLPTFAPSKMMSERPVARTQVFTRGFVKPGPESKRDPDDPSGFDLSNLGADMTEKQAEAKRRRERVAALSEERRQQRAALQARLAEEERRRREAKRRRQRERERAALRIQARHRGKTSRLQTNAIRRQLDEERARRQRARGAARLQAVTRGFLGRSTAAERKREQLMAMQTRAARRIQIRWRVQLAATMLARRALLSTLAANDDYFARMRARLEHDAAATLQRGWRNRKHRAVQNKYADLISALQQSAALVIQKNYAKRSKKDLTDGGRSGGRRRVSSRTERSTRGGPDRGGPDRDRGQSLSARPPKGGPPPRPNPRRPSNRVGGGFGGAAGAAELAPAVAPGAPGAGGVAGGVPAPAVRRAATSSDVTSLAAATAGGGSGGGGGASTAAPAMTGGKSAPAVVGSQLDGAHPGGIREEGPGEGGDAVVKKAG